MTDVLRQGNYEDIIPSANTLEEAINYLKKLYGTTERVFSAYFFDLRQQIKNTLLCMDWLKPFYPAEVNTSLRERLG